MTYPAYIKFRYTAVAGLLLAAALASNAEAQTVIGIAAGQVGSTTFQMMTDVAKTCPNVNVVASEGSLDNIFRISSDKAVQMGYTQEDAAVYQNGQDPDMMKKIQMVFPLFSAEMHLVVPANSKINSLADLAGKKVYVSAEGTGTWVSTEVIRKLTGIAWQGFNITKKEDGLKAIQQGLVDAGFFVEGAPVSLLANAQGIKLIPISHPALDGFKYYTKTMIPSGAYTWQAGTTPTYKVKFALMTYAFKQQYQAEIGGLVSCITRNMGKLQASGHAKWRTVDPTEIDKISWAVHPAAMAAIKRETKGGK
jgi:TRAP transporter TAXI family solute receptor